MGKMLIQRTNLHTYRIDTNVSQKTKNQFLVFETKFNMNFLQSKLLSCSLYKKYKTK